MEDPVYLINNAGLVILAPYLGKYFTLLGLSDDTAFRSEADAARGALLLEYLASGRTEVEAHELLFNKLLCGLAPHTRVPTTVELTELEVETSESMLQAVLQQWERMNSASVDNLQQSFISRPGGVREREGHWSLAVESAAYDVLLSTLPWSIGEVSLPWMELPVLVDWGR